MHKNTRTINQGTIAPFYCIILGAVVQLKGAYHGKKSSIRKRNNPKKDRHT